MANENSSAVKADIDDKKLIKFLKQRHPYWKAQEGYWRIYSQVKKRECDPAELLVKGVSESDAEFKVRCELATWVPESPAIVERIMGFIRRNDCERTFDDSGKKPDYEQFVQKANKQGKDLKSITFGALKESLFFESAFLLIDRNPAPKDEEGNPVLPDSKAAEERTIGLPYIVHYRPHQVVNWSIGNDGALDWVTLRETSTRQLSPFEKPTKVVVYRVFDRSGVHVFTLTPKKGLAEASIDEPGKEETAESVDIERDYSAHKLGVVPLVQVIPFCDDEETPMQGVSFIKTAAEEDVKAFRVESDLLWNQYLHLHPKLVIRSNKPEAIVSIKSSNAIQLSPDDNEDAKYISPDSNVFEQTMKIIQSARDNAWVQTGQEAVARINNDRVKEQSGVHKRLSFEMAEGTILSHLSDVLIQVELDIFEIVSRYLETSDNPGPEENVFQGQITRKKSFDLLWIGDFLETLEKAKPFIQHSTTLTLEATKRLARALLDAPDEEIMSAVIEELKQSRVLMSDNLTTMVDLTDAMKGIGVPSEELMKQFYAQIAREFLPGDDNKEILTKVLEEIDEAELDLDKPDEYEGRLNKENVSR